MIAMSSVLSGQRRMAAANLPPAVAGAVLGEARAAFTAGMNVAGLTAAAVLAVVVVIVAVLFRHVPPYGAAQAPETAQEEPERVSVG
ncbi:MAG: hypothetical protein GEV11_09855 [Streptosporangiales bacterium]|nr:hypothetical protein [Streptosporangiales bacterium]